MTIFLAILMVVTFLWPKKAIGVVTWVVTTVHAIAIAPFAIAYKIMIGLLRLIALPGKKLYQLHKKYGRNLAVIDDVMSNRAASTMAPSASDQVTVSTDHADEISLSPSEETLARVKKIVWRAEQTGKWAEAEAYVKNEYTGADWDYARKSLATAKVRAKVAAEMRANAQKDAAQKAAHKAEAREMVTEARRLIAAKKAEREQAALSVEIPPEDMIPEDNEEQRADYR